LPLTIGAAGTATTASASLTSITPAGQTVVSWTVSSGGGVTGNTAAGTTTLVKDSGPGTLTCSPASVSVSAAQTTGSGFTFTSSTAQKFTCSATVLGSYSYHVHFVNSDANYTNSDSAPIGLAVGNASSLAVQSASGTYAGTVTNLQATLSSSGSINSKTISFSLNGISVGTATTNSSGVATLPSASLAGINAGSYPSGVSATFAGDASLAAASATASLTVAPRAITVTADPKSKTYGDGDPALTYQITSGSLVGSDSFGGALSRAAGQTVGSYAITEGTLALSSDYTLTFVGANLTITKRAVTVTADAKSKTYGDADPALTYLVTSGSVVAGDSFSGSLTRLAGENVGMYAIQQGTLALNSNYTLSYVGANLTIGKALLTVTADDKSLEYGD